MLRHATGYALANEGTDTWLIQDFIGHASIAKRGGPGSNSQRWVWDDPSRLQGRMLLLDKELLPLSPPSFELGQPPRRPTATAPFLPVRTAVFGRWRLLFPGDP